MLNKRTSGLILLSFLLAGSCLMTGCYAVSLPPEAKAGQLLTDNHISAIEYSLYANKQIQIFVNAISARQAALLIEKNDGEAAAAKSALREMKEVLNEFLQINPSLGMEDMKEDTIECMERAIGHMDEYVSALETGSDRSGFKDTFTSDILDLTSKAEFYNQ